MKFFACAALLALTLTGCSVGPTGGSPTPESSDSISVDETLTTATITIPASIMQMGDAVTQETVDASVAESGFDSGVLNEDGSVNGQPEVMNGPGDYLFSTTAQSTVTAILGCQNYDFLPKDQYDVWKDLVLNFNPNMFADTATQ